MNDKITNRILTVLKESDLDGHYPVFQCPEKNLREMIENLLVTKEEFSKRGLIPVVRIQESIEANNLSDLDKEVLRMLPAILTGFVLLAQKLATNRKSPASIVRAFVQAGISTAQNMSGDELIEFLRPHLVGAFKE